MRSIARNGNAWCNEVARIVFIILFENTKWGPSGNAWCKEVARSFKGGSRDVARRSQGGRREGAKHVLSSILGPWESTISKDYKAIEAERAKATDDLKIEG